MLLAIEDLVAHQLVLLTKRMVETEVMEIALETVVKENPVVIEVRVIVVMEIAEEPVTVIRTAIT